MFEKEKVGALAAFGLFCADFCWVFNTGLFRDCFVIRNLGSTFLKKKMNRSFSNNHEEHDELFLNVVRTTTFGLLLLIPARPCLATNAKHLNSF